MAPHNSDNMPDPIQNDSNIFQVFQNVQFNVVQHKKYIKELTKMYKKVNHDVFRKSFSNALHYLFTFGDTNPNVDRVIQFVAKFCTSLDDEEEFLLYIFGIIFNCQSVSGQSVRFRASQLLAAVLTALGDDASLDDDLCDKLLASQLERLQDTRAGVRCRAAIALQRLQNPSDPDDLVSKAYRFHMSCDPSNSVRRAVVMSIAKCSRNLPYVLERLCDVDEGVRRAAFLYVSSVNVTQLKVRQRVHTLKVGLTERSPRVRRVVEEILVPGWLGRFQGNVIELLTAIRLDNIEGAKESRVVAGKMLESLFKRLPVSELLEWLPTDPKLRLVPAEKLTKETTWYWRYLANHLHAIDDTETLEMVLPDLVVFAGYIRAIVEDKCPDPINEPVLFGTRMYVLEELACMLPMYDLADEVGRAALQQLLFDTLVGHNYLMTPDVLRAFVSAIELVLPDPTKRIEFVSSIISELRDPSDADKMSEDMEVSTPAVESTEIKLQRARLRVSLNVALEAQEEAVQKQDYALAAECKARVDAIHQQIDELNVAVKPVTKPQENKAEPVTREKRDDPETLNKCLIILNTLLDTPQITTITPLLKLIYQELEVEIFQNAAILENALQTVALYAMLDEQFCKEHQAFFFAHLIDRSNERIVTTALRCIVDLLCVHGVSLFQESDSSSPEQSTPQELESAPEGGKRKASMGGNRTALYDVSQGVDMGADDDEEVIDKTMSQLSQSHGTIIELLLRFMDSECDKYRLISVEGICRLLTLRNLVSASILSRLFLIWFNPATEEEDLLRQTLGVFFQTFSCAVEGAQEQIQAAIYPTLKALAYAPVTSPLTEINFEEVIRFIVSLTRVHSSDESVDLHGNLAVELCSQIISSPMAPVVPLLCRTLSLLRPPRNLSLARELNRSIDVILEKVPEKTACRHLTKYQANLEALEINSAPKMTLDSIGEAAEDQSTDAELTQRLVRLSTADSVAAPVDEAPVFNDPETVIEETDSSPSSEKMQSSPPKRPKMTESHSKSVSSPRSTRASSVSFSKENTSLADKPVQRSARAGARNVVVDSEVQGAKASAKKKTRSGQNAEADATNSASKPTNKREKRKSIEQSPPKPTGIGAKAKSKIVVAPTRKSNRISAARSTSDSSQPGSQESRLSQDSSGDDTTLHTVMYEKEKDVSTLNDSSDDEVSNRSKNRGTNLTVPETPETSEKSESSAEEEELPRPRRTRARK